MTWEMQHLRTVIPNLFQRFSQAAGGSQAVEFPHLTKHPRSLKPSKQLGLATVPCRSTRPRGTDPQGHATGAEGVRDRAAGRS